MTTLIDDIFATHVKATERAFDKDRSRTVGASEVGQCERKIWWVKHGMAPDADYNDSWGARVRGTVFENAFWWPAMKRRFGKALKLAGSNQMTLQDGYLSATPDGLVVDQPRNILASLGVPDIGESGSFLLECKTADPRLNLARPKPEHELQLQTQLGLVRMKTAYKPGWAILSYNDASWWNEIRVFTIPFNASEFVSITSRAAKIMKAGAFSEMQPEGWIQGGRECEYCPFAKPCGHQRKGVPKNDPGETNTQFAAEIAELALQHNDHKERLGEIEMDLRATEEAIKERLREHQVRKIKSNNISVMWSQVKGRQSFDNVRMREAAIAAGIDVEQFSTVGEPTDRLVIKIG